MAERQQRDLPQPQDHFACMKKYGLLAEIRRRRKWQQMGQHVHKYQNLLNRNFQAAAPNCKWVTDISYIQTKQGVLYLSMIRDLYDNSIVAYKTATQQNGEPGAGHHPPSSTQRKEEGRRRVAAPQRPRLSIHIPSIFQADSTIRHYAFDVKTWKPHMTMQWQKISSPFSKQSASTAINRQPTPKQMK